MNRSTLALLLSLLTVSAPLRAQSATPVEDPRKCLFDEAPAAERAKAADIEKRIGYWRSEQDKLYKSAIARCMAAKGWSNASADALMNIIVADSISREAAAVVKAKGFEIDWVDGFLETLDAPTRSHMDIMIPKGPYFRKKTWPLLASRFGRPVEDEKEMAALMYYVGYRRELADSIRAFRLAAETAPGMLMTDAWQILPAVEASRPAFAPRTLTKEERAELRTVSEHYSDRNSPGSGSVAELKRLQQLGETGDKEAMIAARDALAGGPPRELLDQYWTRRANTSNLYTATAILTAIWTAHIWQRHGYDDADRKYMKPCIGGIGTGNGYKRREVNAVLRPDGTVAGVNSNGYVGDDASEACGFVLLGQSAATGRPKGATVLESYYLGQRQPERDFFITGARFNPVMGDAAFLESRFQAHLKMRQAGELSDKNGNFIFTPSREIALRWYEKYARDTGRLAQLQDADARHSEKLREQLSQARSRADQQWAQAVSDYNANRSAIGSVEKLMNVATGLGLEYFGKFVALVPDWDRSPANASSSAYGGGPGFGSQQVQVRTYDSNGNYTGSTQTSAVWADIMKMSSSPAR